MIGCGSGSSGPVVVRVGEASIGAPIVSHWAHAFALGKEVGGAVGESHDTARERALDFLISASWLIGEASDRGVRVPDAMVERRLQERVESVLNGESEFKEELASLGQTTADVKLEIEAEMAAAMLRAMVSRQVQPVTQADVSDYYAHDRGQFRVAALRSTDLIEAIPTRAAAIALGRRIGAGRRFAGMALHEQVAMETPREATRRGNAELVDTIFAAVPGRVAGPVRFRNGWALVVVRRVVPGSVKPLAAVKEQIAAQLTRNRRRAALLSFIKAYRSKWVAKTDCIPGFVVQKCSRYHGPVASEGDPLLNENA
jgi:parvulin-like peptidyl-prolyl isomerase